MLIFFICFLVVLVLVLVVVMLLSVKIFVYCLEGLFEGFDLVFYILGMIFDVLGYVIYNCFVQFKFGIIEIELGLVESWDVLEDGLEYIFYLCFGVKFYLNDKFILLCDFNVDDVIFIFNCQVSVDDLWYQYIVGIIYEYYLLMEMDKLIKFIEKVDDIIVKFMLNQLEVLFLVNVVMFFVLILFKEYVDMLDVVGIKEDLNNVFIGIGLFKFVVYQKDVVICYQKNVDYWGEVFKIDDLIFVIIFDVLVCL